MLKTSRLLISSETAQRRCVLILCSAQRLREELKEIALKRCDDSVAKFAACAREKGMMVVFSCRGQNKLSESANEPPLLVSEKKLREDVGDEGTAVEGGRCVGDTLLLLCVDPVARRHTPHTLCQTRHRYVVLPTP